MEAIRAEAGTVERLRERIRELQAAPRQLLPVLRTGVGPLDALLPGGGFPCGQAVELAGEAASGRTSVALRTVAAAHAALRLAAYVDGASELHPAAARALGVQLSQLLWVRPPDPGRLAWATLQLVRSGAFPAVVLDLGRLRVRLSPVEAKRLGDAAARSGTLLLVLAPEAGAGEVAMRLRFRAAGPAGFHVEVVRSRQGGVARGVDVAWSALFSGEGPIQRTRSGRRLEAVPGELAAHPGFRRSRPGDLRNGVVGIQGQRPGRDLALPSFGEALGLED